MMRILGPSHRARLALAFVLVTPAGAIAASIEARHGAVAAEHRLASAAGVEILQRGGNAVDAAVAAALVTGVVNPSSSGLGGGGFLVVWDAKRSRAAAIDFRECAPGGASETMFVRGDGSVDAKASRIGPLAVAVPGEPRGLALALKRHGRLRFADVAVPAIRVAREGFVIEAHLAAMIAAAKTGLPADAELARVFFHPDGSPRREGETLKRPELAATLERLARVGVDDFYEGEIAADIVRTVARPPAATLTARDLAAYRPIERDPLVIRYRGRTILSIGPPSSGGAVLGEALGVLSAWDIAGIDPQGATWAHLMAETLKAVFADRATWYGDPAFTNVPLERLLSSAHADAIRSKLSWKRATPSAEIAPRVDTASDAGTSHISVVDADGNAAALTTSVNTGFGSGLSVPGRDIVLNNTMDDFSAQPGKANAFGLVGSSANAVAPGKRPLSSMTPVIVLEDGRVRLVAGASGGPLIITSTLETVMGVVDFGLGADAAVNAPRIHHQWLPEVLLVEAGLPDATLKALARVGHKVVPLRAKASVQAVEVKGTGAARVLYATSDPRKGGVPAGY
ncbi:MAG: gamma-glutamyltransferase [Candidatus Binatia bacterium]